uniref:Uncharacterized protein n=1 Tax=Streptomyces phage Scarif TaxID=3158858 RepID=A0AAU7GYZ0_9CAUD
MSLKTLGNKISQKFSKQVLTVKTHSPVLMLGAGAIGVGATVFLACRATLKVSDILEEGESHLEKADHLNNINEEERKKAKFGVKLQTAIKIAKAYAPATIVGVASIGLMTGSHIILKRRNAATAAALATVSKGFQEYRSRVVADQGKEKDLEYRFGTAEKEIAEEGPNGIETKLVKGPDLSEVKKQTEWDYARVFDDSNDNWSSIPNQNQMFIQMVENHANRLLTVQGFVFLNEVYEMLGFPKTAAGQIVGWVVNPREGKGDGVIDFGVFNDGVYKGKQWVNGHKPAILLDFNVDGPVLDLLPKV